MKRTKNINHARFRKVHVGFKVSMVAVLLASTLVLNGCDNSDDDVYVYRDVKECTAYTSNKDQCQKDWNDAAYAAVKDAPKYASKEECIKQYGDYNCQVQNTTTSTGGTSMMWYPLMSGFSSSSHSQPARSMYSSTSPSSKMYGNYYSGNGVNYGKTWDRSGRSVGTDSVRSTSRTYSRGGFGSSVSSHSSSSRSSGSHSFGG